MQMSISLNAGVGIALVLGCALGGCGKLKQSDPREETRLRAETKRHQSACGSSAAFASLKGLLFDQAIKQRDGDRAALDTLADYSFVRMDKPVVAGFDPALDITRCRGRLILEVPAGARPAFSEQQHLGADVDYSAQAAADGNGFVYQLTSSVPFVAQLAAFHLNGQAYRPPAAFDEQRVAAPVEVVQADAPIPPPHVAEVSVPAAALRPAPALRRTPVTVVAEAAPAREVASSGASRGTSGESTVRTFYDALGAGNGGLASAQIIPEKQDSRAYSPAAIERFYGRMPEPLRLTGVEPLAGGSYRVSYRYSTGRSRCNGSAVVNLANRNGRAFIRSIRALSGC